MGNPFRWVELNTDDLDGAKEFYSEIFDWKMKSFEESSIPYYFINTGGDAEGGMMAKTNPHTPTAWTPLWRSRSYRPCATRWSAWAAPSSNTRPPFRAWAGSP